MEHIETKKIENKKPQYPKTKPLNKITGVAGNGVKK